MSDLDDLLDDIAPVSVPDDQDDDKPDDGERYREHMRHHRRVRMSRKRKRASSDDDGDGDELMFDSDADFDGDRIKRPKTGAGASDSEEERPIQLLQGVGGAVPDGNEEENAEGLMPMRTYVSIDEVAKAMQRTHAGESDDEPDNSDDDPDDPDGDKDQGTAAKYTDEVGLTDREKQYCVLCHYKPQRQDTKVRLRFEELLGILVMRYSEMDRVALGKLAKKYYDSWIRPNITAEPHWSIESILEHIEHHEINGAIQRVRLCRTLLTVLETIRQNHLFTNAEGEGYKVDTRGVQIFLRISTEVEKLLRKIENQIASSGT